MMRGFRSGIVSGLVLTFVLVCIFAAIVVMGQMNQAQVMREQMAAERIRAEGDRAVLEAAAGLVDESRRAVAADRAEAHVWPKVYGAAALVLTFVLVFANRRSEVRMLQSERQATITQEHYPSEVTELIVSLPREGEF